MNERQKFEYAVNLWQFYGGRPPSYPPPRADFAEFLEALPKMPHWSFLDNGDFVEGADKEK